MGRHIHHKSKAGKKQVFARAELFAQTRDQLKLVATGDAILVPV
jgi:hypothetical protein